MALAWLLIGVQRLTRRLADGYVRTAVSAGGGSRDDSVSFGLGLLFQVPFLIVSRHCGPAS